MNNLKLVTLLSALMAVTLVWTSAHAADPDRAKSVRPATQEKKEAKNMIDFSKRIVYSVDGMQNVTSRNVVYKSDGDAKLSMNIYTPTNLASDARLPVVLFIHGGPIPADMTPPTEWGIYQSYGELIAASGFISVTFNHRLFSQNDYARSQSDVVAAIEYVQSHAKELHVEANRLALWIYSGGGPHLSWILRDRPKGLRCVLAFYSLLDMRPFLPANVDPAIATAVERLSAAAQVKEHGAGLPMFIARAGLDTPMINQGLDKFVSEALAANANIEVMNHPHGQHSFDALNDDDRSREIIARAVAFIQTQTKAK